MRSILAATGLGFIGVKFQRIEYGVRGTELWEVLEVDFRLPSRKGLALRTVSIEDRV